MSKGAARRKTVPGEAVGSAASVTSQICCATKVASTQGTICLITTHASTKAALDGRTGCGGDAREYNLQSSAGLGFLTGTGTSNPVCSASLAKEPASPRQSGAWPPLLAATSSRRLAAFAFAAAAAAAPAAAAAIKA